MNHLERPRAVQGARFAGNVEALSQMGRKGAQVTNEARRKRRERKDALAEIQASNEAAEIAKLRHSTNEDILSIDGESPDPEERVEH